MNRRRITYRTGVPVDNVAMNALFADAWANHTPTDFQRRLRCSLGYVCAYDGSELVGFVNVAWDGDLHAFLLDPTVRRDRQRRGIGRELVRRATALAAKAGCEWLHVDFDPELKPFYRKCGFRHTEAGLINLKQKHRP